VARSICDEDWEGAKEKNIDRLFFLLKVNHATQLEYNSAMAGLGGIALLME
jgi:hypothetical protein